MDAGLARVTIRAPRRRLDVALPEHPPLADLLPEVLRHAGVGLADNGERHGGWVLRRTDGVALDPGRPLGDQGVLDGELLHLVPARAHWPAPEYDDVVEAIADGARLRGGSWTPQATRIAALVAAGVSLAVGLVSVLAAGPGWPTGAPLALGVAVALLGAGVTASRAYGEGPAGVALGAGAVGYAFSGAALLVAADDPVGWVPGSRWFGAPELLAGSAAAASAAVLGAVGVAAGLRTLAAVATVASLAALSGLVGFVLPGPAVAAGLLSALVLGVGLAPLLAVRLGRLPLPPVVPPPPVPEPPVDGMGPGGSPRVTAPGTWGRQDPHRDEVLAAVTRTEELLAGMLAGHGTLAAAAVGMLVVAGGPAGWALAGIASTALLLQARLFVARRQRVPLLAAGLAGLGMLGVASVGVVGVTGRLALTAGGTVVAVLVVAAGISYARRPPTPYLARAADLLETALVVSVVPVACGVFGLYGRARGLIG